LCDAFETLHCTVKIKTKENVRENFTRNSNKFQQLIMGSEYRKEQFIDQYEHITKLQLLSDEELAQIKRKRTAFEVTIQTANEVKPFIDYIKFEIALSKKFSSIDYENERDGKALDRAISSHVRDLFRMALKRFQDKRKLWEQYVAFAKQKFPNTVTRIYEDMLCFHHKTADFIEAAEYETTRQNYTTAMNFLLQGMGNNKDSCEQLVVAYIQCSIKQGKLQGEFEQKAVLLQASKFYLKFLKDSTDLSIHCELLRKIQNFKYSMNFQNDVLTNLMTNFTDRAEVWDLLASRHLDGVFYEPPKEGDEEKSTEVAEETKKPHFDVCLKSAITIYEKSLDSVRHFEKQKMFTFFIDKLLEHDANKRTTTDNLKIIRRSLGKAFARGFKEEKLSADHFIIFLELRLLNLEKNQAEIEEMLEISEQLYPNSMELYEIAIKYHLETKNFAEITKTFNFAIENNEKSAVDLYRFLCATHLTADDKEKAIKAMIEAVNSDNRKVSEAFQPYYLEYHAATDGIEKTREVYNKLLTTKTFSSLSLDFFKGMIKVEEKEEKKDVKLIMNCYERAVEHFGKENSEVR
jgi:hypothetical protein